MTKHSLTWVFADDLPAAFDSCPSDKKTFVVTGAGIFVINPQELLSFARPAKVADLKQCFRENAPVVQSEGRVRLQHFIPWGLLTQARNFFQMVWDAHQREDVLLIYYHLADTEYHLVHPELISASIGHVDYHEPDTPPGCVRFGTIHSHCDTSAHHSRQDEDDDASSPGVHIIIGDVDLPMPTLCCVASDGECCWSVSPTDLFGPLESATVPSEWIQANVSARPTGRTSDRRSTPRTTRR